MQSEGCSANDFRVTFGQLDPSALISPKEFACLLGITPGVLPAEHARRVSTSGNEPTPLRAVASR